MLPYVINSPREETSVEDVTWKSEPNSTSLPMEDHKGARTSTRGSRRGGGACLIRTDQNSPY